LEPIEMNTESLSVEQNKKVVVEFFSRFSKGDVVGLLELMDDEATWWVSGRIAGLSDTYKKQRFGELLHGVKPNYKGGAMRFTPTLLTAEGDRVAVEAESYAELMNGRIYNNAYHLLFTLANGKIFRVKEYMDTQHAYETFFVP